MEAAKDPWQPVELSRGAHANPAVCPFHTSRELGFEVCSPDLCKGYSDYTGYYPQPCIFHLIHLFHEKHERWDPESIGQALTWPHSTTCREQCCDTYLTSAGKIWPFNASAYDRTTGICLFLFFSHQLKLCTSAWICLETLINQQETPYTGSLHLCCQTHVACTGCTSWKWHWADPCCTSLVTTGAWGATLQTVFYLEHKQSPDLMEIN